MQDWMGCTQVTDRLAESLRILFEKFCRTGEKPDDLEKSKCCYLEKGGNGEEMENWGTTGFVKASLAD